LPPKSTIKPTITNNNDDSNEKENMDDIFAMNSPTEIKLTDDEDDKDEEKRPLQAEPFKLPNATNNINIKPQLTTTTTKSNPNESPKLSSSFTKVNN
jgi:hypothetical protein